MDNVHHDYPRCNDAIDQQHERIFRLMKELKEAVEREDGAEATNRILSTLSVFVGGHFRMEESLMMEAGFPDLEAHREHHAYLAARVEAMVDRFRQGALTPADLSVFMTEWIGRHITAYDGPMARYLAERAAPAVPPGILGASA